MSSPPKQLLSKADVRRRLRIGRTRYDQLIESGILPPPIRLVEGGRALHTINQIEVAETNLDRQLHRNFQPLGRSKMKPLDEKLFNG